MAQVRLGSGLSRIRVSKPGRVVWWQACIFHLVCVCARFLPYTINMERVQQSCYVMVCTYEYVDVLNQVRIAVQ